MQSSVDTLVERVCILGASDDDELAAEARLAPRVGVACVDVDGLSQRVERVHEPAARRRTLAQRVIARDECVIQGNGVLCTAEGLVRSDAPLVLMLVGVASGSAQRLIGRDKTLFGPFCSACACAEVRRRCFPALCTRVTTRAPTPADFGVDALVSCEAAEPSPPMLFEELQLLGFARCTIY